MEGSRFDELLYKYRTPLTVFAVGAIVIGLGIIFLKSGIVGPETKIEVLNGTTLPQAGSVITAEIAGQVVNPGVYKLTSDSRIDDLLIASGGLSVDADREWTAKNLNRAAKLSDGQKVYIPQINEQSNVLSAKVNGGDQTASSVNLSDSNSLININTAGLAELDKLPGIGPVYGQNIIDHRPYSNIEELLSKGVLKKNVYEKIKNLISVY